MIIPVFLATQGCQRQCVYCNQSVITSSPLVHPAGIADLVATYRSPHMACVPQLAYYGGSFTALPSQRLNAYLGVASQLKTDGYISGFRCSTRPDAITPEILQQLHDSGCQAIELGVQSTDPDVLHASGRNRVSFAQLETTMAMLRAFPWHIVIQLMPGLPRETWHSFQETIHHTTLLQPHGVRLYPTLVLRHTPLQRMYQQGTYQPLSLEEAIESCSWATTQLTNHAIQILRIGLQDSKSLRENIIAGPWHPALGELVHSRNWLKLLLPWRGQIQTITLNPAIRSKVVGQKRVNLQLLNLRQQQLIENIDMERGKVDVKLSDGQHLSINQKTGLM